jgi:hypothetical protein
LCIYGDIDKNIGKIKERIDISSCLIPKELGEETFNKLLDIKNHYDYFLPIEKSLNPDFEYVKGLKIEPWLKYIRSDYDGLDSHDPFVNEIAKSIICFDDGITEKFNIEYDVLFKNGYIDNQKITYYENWSEISENTYEHREFSTIIESSGKLFKVDFEFLDKLLKKENKALLIKCIIKREINDTREKYFRNHADIDNRNEVKLYLIKGNG